VLAGDCGISAGDGRRGGVGGRSDIVVGDSIGVTVPCEARSGRGGNVDLGRSAGSCNALSRDVTSETGSGLAGRGILGPTGVLSAELGESGLVMVNLPIASGGSREAIDL
jgi:hypothetical protein